MDVFEQVYYARAIVGVAAGIVAGFVIQVDYDWNTSVLVAIGIAIMFYFISLAVGKSIAKNVPRDKRRKVATDGIIPFIFMLLTFMIIVFTALHQSTLT